MNSGADSLEHCPALLTACSNGLILLISLCRGGIKAMKMESRAAYIGTVMKLLTALRIVLDLALNRLQYDLSRVEGGLG